MFNVGRNEIHQLLDAVWSMIVGLPLQVVERGVTAAKGKLLTACVQITGNWNGAVLLDCDAELGRKIASIMFDQQEFTLTPDQVRDALGEIVNMLGGNMKGLLAPPCYLSIPTVADGEDYVLKLMDSRLIGEMGFECEGLPIIVRVLEAVQKTHPLNGVSHIHHVGNN